MSSWERKMSPPKEDAMKLLAPTLAALALSAFSLAATATVTEADVLGHPAQLLAARRTIVINAKTKWVNVKHGEVVRDRKSTRLNSSHMSISYAVFCLKKKKKSQNQ